ncbi:MAG: hypothetical protein ACAI43_01590 [Phycisphaerae bacterium]|nr:hypothetical protein [Tepidisphaeraceae bacterium]
MRMLNIIAGTVFGMFLNARPIPSERHESYSFWGPSLPVALVILLVAGASASPRRWATAGFVFAGAGVALRVLTYHVLTY